MPKALGAAANCAATYDATRSVLVTPAYRRRCNSMTGTA